MAKPDTALPLQAVEPPADLKISIALATYNGEAHLAEQLQSLAEQTLQPYELVVTDDGSTDNTEDIVRSFAQKASFPVVFHSNPQRLGYGGNFLHAASLCRGDLIAFCDQDDRWLETKLAVCARFFADKDTCLAIHSAETWDGKTRMGRLYPFHDKTEITPPGITDPLTLTPGFAVLFRRTLLELLDNSDRPNCMFGLSNGSIMGHDAWIRLVGAATGKTAQISDVLALYRQHGSNTVGAPGRHGWRRRLELAATNFDYNLLADFESKCADVLSHIDDAAAPAYIVERKELIQQFRRRAKLHRLRASVYGRTSTFISRVRSFFSMLAAGAYRRSAKKGAIGPRAALKDLSFGVSGLYKRFI